MTAPFDWSVFVGQGLRDPRSAESKGENGFGTVETIGSQDASGLD